VQGSFGGGVVVTVMDWLQSGERFPQQSLARHVRVCTTVQGPTMLVVVLMTIMDCRQQLSDAVGGVKFHGVPLATEKLGAQLITGGMVSTTNTVCEQSAKLPQQSWISHQRVIGELQAVPMPLKVPSTVMVTFVPQQASVAIGGSNSHAVLHCTVLLGEHVTVGGVVSTIVTT
jgi:hypothetical protein